MRPDLLHAQASIDWAVAQLPSLQQRLHVWVKANVYPDVIDVNPTSEDLMVVAVEKELLPLSFVVEVGAYINAIRSSLDILATSLADRFGIAGPKDVYFPVAESGTAFRSGGYKGAKFVQGLPTRERGIIEALKPYQGGNATLWALHQLDIMRKHRRLLAVGIGAQSLRIHGEGWGRFKPIDRIPPVDEKTPLGFITRSATKPNMELSAEIAFDETAVGVRQTVVETLQHLAGFASGVVELFD